MVALLHQLIPSSNAVSPVPVVVAVQERTAEFKSRREEESASTNWMMLLADADVPV
jgi:hypothetical protein